MKLNIDIIMGLILAPIFAVLFIGAFWLMAMGCVALGGSAEVCGL